MSTFDYLNDVDFIISNSYECEMDLVNVYYDLYGRELGQADPTRMIFKTIAPKLAQIENKINDTAKQNLLKYAREERLDHKGDFLGVPRLAAQGARAIFRFEISITRPLNVVIPAGTRMSISDFYFATLEEAIVKPGETTVEVEAECSETGAVGNNFLPGQITQLVDVFPYYSSVVNTTITEGGADVETDERYRERINKAPEKFTTAGPDGAYLYWAQTASSTIVDVYVTSPNPGEVDLYVLEKDGKIPEQSMLERVFDVCNDRKIRPLTDKLKVKAAEEKKYNLNMKYWIDSSNEAYSKQITENVALKIEEFKSWQMDKLGRDINPDYLIKLLKDVGVKRAEITEPVFTVLNRTHVALCETESVNYAGLEEE